MGLFEQFPYANFHELNLDWFLSTFKTIIEEWEEQKTQFDSLSDAFTELKDYVSSYFDDLNVQTEVNNKLNAMMLDGSLRTILAGIVAAPDSVMMFSRLGRNINTGNANDGFIGCGAGTMVDDENFLYAVYTDDAVGTVKLIKTNIRTGVSSENVVTGVYHANSATLLPSGNVGFAPMLAAGNMDLVIVDPLTLTVVETLSVANAPAGVQRILGVSYNDLSDEFVFVGATEFYIVDSNMNYVETRQFEMPITYSSVTRQGSCVFDNYVCFTTNKPNQLVCFNMDGSYARTIFFGMDECDNALGEVQNINVYNGYFYANANLTPTVHTQYSEVAFYNCPINGGGMGLLLGERTGYSNTGYTTYIVDETTYNNMSAINKFTANGNTKPFSSLEECQLHMTADYDYRIILRSDNPTDVHFNNRTFTLYANDHHLKTLSVKNCNAVISNVLLDDLRETVADVGALTIKYSLVAYNSNVRVIGNSGVLIGDNATPLYSIGATVTYDGLAPSEAGYDPLNRDITYCDMSGLAFDTDHLPSTGNVIHGIIASGYVTSNNSVINFSVPLPTRLTSRFDITRLVITVRDSTGTVLSNYDATSDITATSIEGNVANVAIAKTLTGVNNTVLSIQIQSMYYDN